MRGILTVVLVVLALGLGGCTAKDVFGRGNNHWKEQDFKPYLGGELHSIPSAYGTQSWAYPEGTSTDEIVRRWQASGLLQKVTTKGRSGIFRSPKGTMSVYVGPQFYNLSASSQRGFAEAVAQIYGLEQSGGSDYLLYDWRTGKGIGVYTLKGGLFTY